MAVALAEGMPKNSKLTTTISTSNMHLFNARGHIRNFESPEEILKAFFFIRLKLYVKRKEVQLQNLELELLKLDNKVRFVLGVITGDIIVNNRKRAELLLELKLKGFTPFPKKSKTGEPCGAGTENPEGEEGNEAEDVGKGVKAGDYEYLLSMPVGTLTLEKFQSLCNDRDKLERDVEELKRATPKSLWLKDLDEFLVQLNLEEAKEEEYEMKHASKEGGRPMKRAPAKKAIPAEKATSKAASQVKLPSKKAAPAKPPTPVNVDSDYEDLGVSLRERLAVYSKSVNVSPLEKTDEEHSLLITVPPLEKTDEEQRELRKVIVDSDNDSGSDADDNSDWDMEEKPKKGKKAVIPAAKKGGAAAGRKTKAASVASRAVAVAVAVSKLEEVEGGAAVEISCSESEAGISALPIHRKSGSIAAKLAAEEQHQEDDVEKEVEVSAGPAAARPNRANRAVVQYVISDDDERRQNTGTDELFFIVAEHLKCRQRWNMISWSSCGCVYCPDNCDAFPPSQSVLRIVPSCNIVSWNAMTCKNNFNFHDGHVEKLQISDGSRSSVSGAFGYSI
ncbi:hypothetical protein GOP47_0008793 [Adiantum capillus-veneris]|uniref:DNA topoisomerase (ATP-hydrolyzing) n=1 Tax=Adiantum capillus-veneris TaxID=13818 RepID=A0A9D4UZY8_ADICA|nr:hypothetical protein GOP47_0008793 [Adiantum capillus-veneris]